MQRSQIRTSADVFFTIEVKSSCLIWHWFAFILTVWLGSIYKMN